MDVVVTITEYRHHLASTGYAAATIEAYGRYLGLFKDYLVESDITDLRTVTRQVISDYQARLAAQPIAAESKALKLRPVKRLFEHLIKTHRLLINPAEGIVETCRKHRKIGCVLSLDEMRRLLEQPNLSLATGIRDRAILEVMYATGIRTDEFLRLKVHHADLKDKILYIRKGKGKKQRVAPLGKPAAARLKEYLEHIRPRHGKKYPKERTLFLTHSGRALSRESLQALVRKYRLAAGIARPVSPHALRRTCATHLLAGGADIRYVQKLLGHSRLATTQMYTRILPTDLKKIHNTTHPNGS
jgi:integrase/recombinase XerD